MIIRYNGNEEMMEIKNDENEVVFYGNYWDFDNNPVGLGNFLSSLGLSVEIKDNLPGYEDEEQ